MSELNILVTGRGIPHQEDRCTAQQLVRGFREAGHNAVFFGNFYGEPYRWIGAAEAASDQFDLIVITEMNDSYPQYDLNTLNLKGVKRLYWDFDSSYHPEQSLKRALESKADGFLIGNKYFIDKFGSYKPSILLPYAFSPSIHRRKEEIKRTHLLGFVGSLSKERANLLKTAQQAIHNLSWIEAAEGVFGESLIDKMNSYCAMFHANQSACAGLVPGRPWESGGCGTTLLMDRQSYNDFTEFLPSYLHDDVFVYDNDEDIRSWIAYWQDKWATLQMSGSSLMAYLHQNHSYRNRAESIVEFAKKENLL